MQKFLEIIKLLKSWDLELKAHSGRLCIENQNKLLH
jgi:hypothetical protein